MVCEETNTYFAERFNLLQNGNKLKDVSRMNKWNDTTRNDFFLFHAVQIMMGIIPKHNIDSYWTKDPLFETPGFAKVMSRDRYQGILRYLHFSSDSGISSDRISKLRPVLDYLIEKFQAAYVPGEHISIDESLVAFKGRLSFKQYNRNKRARFGIKLFVLAESKTGYVYNIIVYCGKEGIGSDGGGNKKKEHRIAENIVLRIVDKLSGKGRKLFVDNWYSSVDLFLKLVNEKNTNVCGTVRSNRKNIPKFQTKKMKKGDMKSFHTSQLSFTVWKDKRVVTMLSTMHKPEMVTTKKQCHITGEFKQKPNVVKDYNDHMGGVDLGDQLIQPYHTSRKSMKWYIKLYFHLLDIAITNAHVIYNEVNFDHRLNHVDFRKARKINRNCCCIR